MKKSIAFISVFLICVLSLPLSAFAEAQQGNPATVVFVIDDSRSMKTNDAEKLTVQAVQMYLDRLSDNEDTGSKVGIVTFSGKVVEQMPLRAADGKDNKVAIKKEVQRMVKQKSEDTNCGTGIKAALDMLKSDGSANPKAIIMVTDGEYDYGDAKTTKAQKDTFLSDAQKLLDEQLNIAANGDGSENETYRIFTIKIHNSLKDLKPVGKVPFDKIESKTVAKHYEAKTAEEVRKHILDIQSQLGIVISDSHERTIDLEPGKPSTQTFDIPKDVLYANIQVVHTAPIQIDSFTYADNGEDVSYESQDESANGYTNIRFNSPREGKVALVLLSKEKQKATINFVFVPSLNVELEAIPANFDLKQPFSLTANVSEKGNPITDSGNSILIRFVIKDEAGNVVAEDKTTTNNNGQFTSKNFAIDKDGAYIACAELLDDSGAVVAATNDYGFEVGSPGGGGLPIWAWILIALGALLVIGAIVFIFLKKDIIGPPIPPFGRFQYTYVNYSTGVNEPFFVWILEGKADKKTGELPISKLMPTHTDVPMLNEIVFTASGNKKAPVLMIANKGQSCTVSVGVMNVGASPVQIKRDDTITIECAEPNFKITAKRT